MSSFFAIVHRLGGLPGGRVSTALSTCVFYYLLHCFFSGSLRVFQSFVSVCLCLIVGILVISMSSCLSFWWSSWGCTFLGVFWAIPFPRSLLSIRCTCEYYFLLICLLHCMMYGSLHLARMSVLRGMSMCSVIIRRIIISVRREPVFTCVGFFSFSLASLVNLVVNRYR